MGTVILIHGEYILGLTDVKLCPFEGRFCEIFREHAWCGLYMVCLYQTHVGVWSPV